MSPENQEHLPLGDAMSEGEEPPPAGVRVMGLVRWGILAAAALLACFAWWSYASADPASGSRGTEAAPKYHCPMHPQIVSNTPGECPICHMTLEPISASRSRSPADAARRADTPAAGSMPPGTTPITLTLDRTQAIGVRTALVGESQMGAKLRVSASIAPAEQGLIEVHVRTAGFVEGVQVNQSGVPVAAKQVLFTFYSPEIFQAESELLAARKWGQADAGAGFAAASRSKLELLGMSRRDIDEVLRTGEPLRAIPIYAPQAGVVTQKTLVAGAYVTPEMALYEILDLSRVYVIADVFQRDAGGLAPGTTGRFIPTERAERATDARVDLIYPSLNAEARTTRVRMQIKNPSGATFRPGEYGTVEFSAPSRRALTVPRDAVIDTGLYTYVFVAQENGRFTPRVVTLGEAQGDRISVQTGLTPGERVVSGATFLIDSESKLQSSSEQASPDGHKP